MMGWQINNKLEMTCKEVVLRDLGTIPAFVSIDIENLSQDSRVPAEIRTEYPPITSPSL
jgi:hypothetical protein